MQELAKLREFAARYTAAWCSHDAAKVAAFYSPSGSLTINDGAPAVGREAIAEAARAFMTAFPDLQVDMDDVRVERDHAVSLDLDGHQHRTGWHWEKGAHQRV